MNSRILLRAGASAWLALLVATIIIVAQMATKPPRPIYADEIQYLSVSRNIAVYGVYSDDEITDTDRVPAPDAFFTPVAPLLYALLLKVDPSLNETITCQLLNPDYERERCTISYSLLTRGVMAVLAIIGLWGSWILARSLGLSPVGAWAVLGVVAVSGTHALFARHFLTETPLLAIFPFFLALLARATDPAARDTTRILLGLGVVMALLTLTRPSYAYQAYAVILALPLLRRFRGAAAIGPYGLGALLLVTASYVITILPWMLRNALTLGELSLTTGYDVNILSQRMIYNQMTWGEWFRAWIYWLPDFGDNLAIRLFGRDAVIKLSLVEAMGYHGGGYPPIPRDYLWQPDGQVATLGYLLTQHLLPNLPKHVAVTLVMAWQGLWAGKYITFIAVLLAPLALWRMAATGMLRGFLVIAAPVLLMVGFYAFVSVSIPRYNLPMLWISGTVAAVLVEAAVQYFRRRGNRDTRNHTA